VLPFGLKNAGATYQRLMNKVLASMLGRNVQAYVDDMIVTSLEKSQHVADLEELFVTVPFHPRALTKVKVNVGAKVNIWWDHTKGPKERKSTE